MKIVIYYKPFASFINIL